MNREIKFRGKRKDTNEFVYGYFWKASNDGYYISIDESGRGDWCNLEIYPETLGQYTGLNDNERKEIYEKDIVECFDSFGTREQVEVYFRNGAFHFKRSDGRDLLEVDTDYMEVIGQVF